VTPLVGVPLEILLVPLIGHTHGRAGVAVQASTGWKLLASVGVWRLWVAGKSPDVPWSTRTFVGSLALGWGLFNFIEGLVDHQLLGIHHVHPGQLAWDLGFLALGLALSGSGWMLVRAGRADATPRAGLVADHGACHRS